MALFFEWCVALHDLEINRVLAGKRTLGGGRGRCCSASAGRRGARC